MLLLHLLDLLDTEVHLLLNILYECGLPGFSLLAAGFDVGKNLLAALLLGQNALLILLLILEVPLSLLFKLAFQLEVLLGQHHCLLFGLLIDLPLLRFPTLGFEWRRLVKKLIALLGRAQRILGDLSVLDALDKELLGIVVLDVDRLGEAVLAATCPMLGRGDHLVSKVTLMDDE